MIKKLGLWTGIMAVLLIATIILGSKAITKQNEWKATEAYIASQNNSLEELLNQSSQNGAYDLSRDLGKEILVSEEGSEEVNKLLKDFFYTFLTYENLQEPFDKSIGTESFQEILERNKSIEKQSVKSEKHYLIYHEDMLLAEAIVAIRVTIQGEEIDTLRRFTIEMTEENGTYKINNFTTSNLEALYWGEDPWMN